MSKVVAGDFLGTGKMQLADFYNYENDQTGLWLFSATSTPPFQSEQVWDRGVGKWRATAVSEIMAGDFSGSGKMEIATFYDYDFSTTGVWMFAAASSTSFQPKLEWKGNLSAGAVLAVRA